MCFYVYLKYTFAFTYLFLFLRIAIYNTVLEVLVVSLCKPVIHKLNISGGEKLEYYKINAGNHTMGEGGGNLGGNYTSCQNPATHS